MSSTNQDRTNIDTPHDKIIAGMKDGIKQLMTALLELATVNQEAALTFVNNIRTPSSTYPLAEYTLNKWVQSGFDDRFDHELQGLLTNPISIMALALSVNVKPPTTYWTNVRRRLEHCCKSGKFDFQAYVNWNPMHPDNLPVSATKPAIVSEPTTPTTKKEEPVKPSVPATKVGAPVPPTPVKKEESVKPSPAPAKRPGLPASVSHTDDVSSSE